MECTENQLNSVVVDLRAKLSSFMLTLSLDWIAGDTGDHVVIINTRHVAMEGDLWRTFTYHHYTGYALISVSLSLSVLIALRVWCWTKRCTASVFRVEILWMQCL